MVTYDNTTPAINQTIAQSQPLILGNFDYLKTQLGQEHNFDATGVLTMYHLQCSMPNKAVDPAALPTGTNGMYYVKGAVPKYYDGTTASFFQLASSSGFIQKYITGSIGLTTSYQTVTAIPADSVGLYWLFVKGGTGVARCAPGVFVSDSNSIFPQSSVITGGDPGMDVQGSGLNFQAKLSSSTATITYLFVYFNP